MSRSGCSELLEALERQRQLLEAVSRGEYCCLRHGLPYVTPGDIASQAVCEMRLHLDLSRGGAREPRRRELRLLVEAVLRARRRLGETSCDRLALSAPVAGVVEGVPVIGRPDAILVDGGRVHAIVWAKTSERLGIAPWDRARLDALALAADYGGLPLKPLTRLVLVVGRDPSSVRRGLERVWEGPTIADDYAVHVMAYDRHDSLRRLEPLLAYWLGHREPQARPTRLCSRCPYRSECPGRTG